MRPSLHRPARVLLLALASLEDERAVKPLAEAVAKCKSPSVRYPALLGLGRFSTGAAFEALRAAASDADEDFRW